MVYTHLSLSVRKQNIKLAREFYSRFIAMVSDSLT